MLKFGSRWTDTLREIYGPKKALYNRFVHLAAKGVWVGLLRRSFRLADRPVRFGSIHLR